MSYATASIGITPAPLEPRMSRMPALGRGWLARFAERRRSLVIARALLRSGDREMVDIANQILGGRPVEEIFAER
jgi:hypothetical protein